VPRPGQRNRSRIRKGGLQVEFTVTTPSPSLCPGRRSDLIGRQPEIGWKSLCAENNGVYFRYDSNPFPHADSRILSGLRPFLKGEVLPFFRDAQLFAARTLPGISSTRLPADGEMEWPKTDSDQPRRLSAPRCSIRALDLAGSCLP